jgi:hypothetical protein
MYMDHDTAIDGRPMIRCAWPDTGGGIVPGPVHTLEETADYMRDHGMPSATKLQIREIEQRALRKLRHHPAIIAIRSEATR